MHEVGIVNDALEIASDAAKASGASRIIAVRMKVGELSGVEPEALSFAFEVVAASTIAAGAQLTIETVSATCICRDCGNERIGRSAGPCPLCGGESTVAHGYELLVSSIEVD
jgi:hydrogenase nickel incorporation protein HypA/HybF